MKNQVKQWLWMLSVLGLFQFFTEAPTRASDQDQNRNEMTQKGSSGRLDTDTGWTQEKGIVLKGTIVTMTAESAIVTDGQMLVRNKKIISIIGKDQTWPQGIDPTGAIVIDTKGLIFPGMINNHNHVAYNMLPMWEAPKLYSNRYQWTSPPSYSTYVNYPKKILSTANYLNLAVETLKWSEIKSLIGGETAVQGTPCLSGVSDILVHNIECGSFGIDKISQRGLTVDDERWQITVQATIIDKVKAGLLDAFIVHLAEGIDEASRAEFDTIKELGLVIPETVIIHGTGLTEAEFQQMGQAGMKIVWSPLSNLLLYGKTTNIPAALQAGVLVSLGSDWSPSGSKNLLGELKIADRANKILFNSYITDYQLVQFATSNASKVIKWDNLAGFLKEGLYADITVIKDTTKTEPFPTAYRALINSTEKDVILTLVEGEPLYGDVDVMHKLKPSDYDIICGQCGFVKAVDTTKPLAKKGDQTFNTMKDMLTTAMQFHPEDMIKVFKDAVQNNMTLDEFKVYLKNTFPNGLAPIPLDPAFVTDDTLFFQRLAASANMAKAMSMSDFQSVYYPFMGQAGTQDISKQVDAAKVLEFVNKATQDVLIDEVGIDMVTASNIISHITSVGPFTTLDQLVEVAKACTVLLIDAYIDATKPPEPPPPPPDETPEQKALKFLNHASTTLTTLKSYVGLSSTIANSIMAYRNGPDGKYPSSDDNPFDSIAELDAVSNVGPTTIQKIIDYAKTWKPTEDPVNPDKKTLDFLNHVSTTYEVLNTKVGLSTTISNNIINHRNGSDKIFGTSDDNPYDSIAELDAVPYVGATTITTIKTYADKWTPPVDPNPDKKLLDFVNHPSTGKDVLIKAGLTSVAAGYVIQHRDGPDGLPKTADDNLYDTKAELSTVPYVDASSITKLVTYAATWSPPPEIPKVCMFLNHETTTYDVLKTKVGLTVTMATNIMAHRNGKDGIFGTADDNPFDSVEEIDSVPYVGSSTITKLEAYAQNWNP